MILPKKEFCRILEMADFRAPMLEEPSDEMFTVAIVIMIVLLFNDPPPQRRRGSVLGSRHVRCIDRESH